MFTCSNVGGSKIRELDFFIYKFDVSFLGAANIDQTFPRGVGYKKSWETLRFMRLYLENEGWAYTMPPVRNLL